MAIKSAIEWTESTWNPVTGCTKVSPGCANCYAARLAKRLKAMGQANYANGFEVTLHDPALNLPLKWKKPQTIFVNSMSDLFHERIPEEFILQVFDVMRQANWHCFQVLTKRPERLREVDPRLPWSKNVWMGVSVENRDYLYRADYLRETGARLKFLSIEPLLGSLGQVNLDGIDWVIVGGESGAGARPMKESWVIEILEQCKAAGVPFFFKQWGGVNKRKTGRSLGGRTWDEMPESYNAPGSLIQIAQ
ncbi:MAG: phage Gp37/Gp68 family protein [Firmicutes bacterium]|nr:phage Gp37/Gp68 family protein [Bacillota bacterium]